ncbi:MAG: 2-oxoacid:acceptor oxidoreductase subunit alpha [Alphaproteobacteria bacterium]
MSAAVPQAEVTVDAAPGAQRVLSDINVKVAGQGGDGSLTIITLLTQVLSRRGFHLYSARDVASRIKGGHAAATLRGSTVARGGMGDHIDLLVAFDEEAIELVGAAVAPDGIVIYDASRGPLPDGYLADTVRVFAVPFGRMAVRDLRRDLFKNSVAFGLLARILDIGDDEAEGCMRQRFKRLPERLINANLEAVYKGHAYADDNGLGEGQGPWRLSGAAPAKRVLMGGNDAVAFGFLAAGGRFYAGYPITPATELLDWLSARLPAFGGVAIQAEDELSAINMAIGAAITGTRAMTGSSGPGIALMQEALSHLGSAEIPLVIVDSQRAGPSTGMPTKPEQSDIAMLALGGHGDIPRVVLAPGNPRECFDIGVLATNLAQRLQSPVIIALDQAVAQDAMTVEPFDLDGVTIEHGKRLSPDDVACLDEYRRYQITDDGVSPWAVPGTPGGESLVTGNERNEWGLVSTNPENRVRMMDKRARKVDLVRESLPGAHRFGDPDAAIGLLGVGMQGGVMIEAAERLIDAGVAVQVLRPLTLWPVAEETLAFIRQRRRVYVIEHSASAQLYRVLAAGGASTEALESILKYDGTPFRPAELVDAVMAGEGGKP